MNKLKLQLLTIHILTWVLTIIFLPLHLIMIAGEKLTALYERYIHAPIGRYLNNKKWELRKKLNDAELKMKNKS